MKIIIVIVVACLALIGCGVVTDADIAAAEKTCELSGGIDKLSLRGWKVSCKNGNVVTDFNPN
jgi:uncharacterized protein YceK